MTHKVTSPLRLGTDHLIELVVVLLWLILGFPCDGRGQGFSLWSQPIDEVLANLSSKEEVSPVQWEDAFESTVVVRGQPVFRGQSGNAYWNSVYNPYTPTVYLAQDPASLQPTISGVSPSASPAVPASSSIAPPITQGTSTLPPATGTSGGLTQPINKFIRFWHNFSFDYTHICKGKEDTGAGLDEFNLYSEFSIPCKMLPPPPGGANQGYLFLVPGFTLDLWSGNVINGLMPKETFNASLSLGSRPQFSKEFGLEAWVQFGFASSFKKVTNKGLYVRGKAVGTLAITDDGRFYATGGAIYLGRNHIKILPVAGVIWRPNERNIWRLVFPDPRLDRYLGKLGENDWWMYVQGVIGGDNWLLNEYSDNLRMDYNEYRIGVGLACETTCGMTAHVEFGGSFAREFYTVGTAIYKPDASYYIKAGLSY